jgi:hypothetical protein
MIINGDNPDLHAMISLARMNGDIEIEGIIGNLTGVDHSKETTIAIITIEMIITTEMIIIIEDLITIRPALTRIHLGS